ncbi:MAG TPA: hypothetical protein VM187_07155 [Niastella sp.]|nr:hypothetical protein [Niastella sp.]
MLTFKIRPDGLREIKKKILVRGIPFSLASLGIAYVVSTAGTAGNNDNIKPVSYYGDTSTDLIISVIPIVVFIAVITFSFIRTLKRVKKIFESYELTISDNLIAREQLNTPTISIYLTEVQEIIKRKNKAFIIRGKTARDMILVPAQIENYEQLEIALEQIKPVTNKGKTISWMKAQALLALAGLGLMVCVYTFENKIIVGVSAVLFAGIYVYSFIQTQKSKNVDYRTKRFRWVILLVVASIVGTAVMKLIN